MKRGITLPILALGLALLSACGPQQEQAAASLTGSFTRAPFLITAAAPTVTPERTTATPFITEEPVSLPYRTSAAPGETPAPTISPTPFITPTPRAASAEALCDLAKSLQDTPHAPGGSDPKVGFDTAGFVYYCLKELGVSVAKGTPRELADNDSWKKVSYLSSAKAGDLLFFVTGEEQEIDCVCIYLGNGKMTYPSTSRGAVITVSSDTEYWKNHFRLGRRIF